MNYINLWYIHTCIAHSMSSSCVFESLTPCVVPFWHPIHNCQKCLALEESMSVSFLISSITFFHKISWSHTCVAHSCICGISFLNFKPAYLNEIHAQLCFDHVWNFVSQLSNSVFLKSIHVRLLFVNLQNRFITFSARSLIAATKLKQRKLH